eukprot:9057978-Alexandrium_andersonii.AAC.1
MPCQNEGRDKIDQPQRNAAPFEDCSDPSRRRPFEGFALVDEKDRAASRYGGSTKAGGRLPGIGDRPKECSME